MSEIQLERLRKDSLELQEYAKKLEKKGKISLMQKILAKRKAVSFVNLVKPEREKLAASKICNRPFLLRGIFDLSRTIYRSFYRAL
jgi:hypothetical protein